LSHADELGRVGARRQAIEHRHRGVGVDAPADQNGQRLAGVLVDDVHELQDVPSAVSNWKSRAQTWSVRSARPACGDRGDPEPHPLAAPDGHPQAR
jgi:hypothetical protein